jgi:sterol 3beta-glucosyltransferase
MDFSETIEVKVLDKEEHFSVDSYFFAYFHNLAMALDQIRDAVRAYRTLPEKAPAQGVLDTTLARPPQYSVDRTHSSPIPEQVSKPTGTRLSSLLRPFQDTLFLGRAFSVPEDTHKEEFTHVWRRGNIPVTTSPTSDREAATDHGAAKNLTIIASSSRSDHTYPPSTSPVDPIRSSGGSSSPISWSVGVPSWLKVPSRLVLGSSSVQREHQPEHAATSPTNPTGISEVYSSGSKLGNRSGTSDLGYSILETPGQPVEPEVVEKFRTAFAFDDKECLLGCAIGSILITRWSRTSLPRSRFPRLYFSPVTCLWQDICFIQLLLLQIEWTFDDKDTRMLVWHSYQTRIHRIFQMILPIRDILTTEKSRATRFGHYGLAVIVKGHEELFFEFNSEDRRNLFVTLLSRQMEEAGRNNATGGQTAPTKDQCDALILEEFGATAPNRTDSDPRPIPENMTDSLPAVMFTSASSTFLTFKPKESMHFTFLTIGSRGDVQPYIALAKGLLADGHRVRISTHGEFREWIESVCHCCVPNLPLGSNKGL